MWVDASTSHARPPAGVTADPSQYGLLGGRLSTELDWGAATLSGRYGEAFTGSAGRWLQGDASVATGGRVGAVGLRALVSGFGLRYLDPFSYDAAGVEIRPAVSRPTGRFILSALPRLSFGRWSADPVEGDLRVMGGEVQAQRSFGALSAVVSGGAASVENGVTAGTFVRAGGDLILDRGRWTTVVQVETQRSPEETEVGGGVRFSLTMAPGLEVRGYAGKRLRDPLFGTASSVSLSLSVAVRAVRWSPPRPPPVASVGEARDGGRVVRFAIRAPEAETVKLTGDFTGWEPVAMEQRDDGWWRTTRVLPPGLHHFGFLVDDEWAIPPEAPGVVEDGWGRRNASIVVEP